MSSSKRNGSKQISILLLAILVISFLLSAGQVYNLILSSSKSFTFLSFIWIVLMALTGIGFYFMLVSQNNVINQLNGEIQSLKSSLESVMLKKEDKKETVKTKEKVDFEVKIEKILPKTSTSDMEKYGEELLANIAQEVEIVQGLLYQKNSEGIFSYTSGYAFYSETTPPTYTEGETLSGQVAKNKQVLNVDKIPDNYITILSGLGKASPNHLLIFPIIDKSEETVGIVELAAFKPFNKQNEELFSRLGRKLGDVITANSNN